LAKLWLNYNLVQPWQKHWLNKKLANLGKPYLKFGKIRIWLKLDKKLAKLNKLVKTW
jgi:hypothetical protein